MRYKNCAQGRILFLTNNDGVYNTIEWLESKYEVIVVSEPLSMETLDQIVPDFIVSYGYRYIVPAEIINKYKDRIINLHISYLPYNRGANPNFWSFIDDTPKGVTIHRMSAELDKGEILCQKRVFFDERVETFYSTYNKLQDEIVKLFKECWKDIYEGKMLAVEQTGKGTYHSISDFKGVCECIDFEWSDNISEVKNKYCAYIDSLSS